MFSRAVRPFDACLRSTASGPGRVLGQRAPAQQLGVVIADLAPSLMPLMLTTSG